MSRQDGDIEIDITRVEDGVWLWQIVVLRDHQRCALPHSGVILGDEFCADTLAADCAPTFDAAQREVLARLEMREALKDSLDTQSQSM